MRKDNPAFQSACENFAEFVWGKEMANSYGGKRELWNCLPQETKDLISDFIQINLKGPSIKTEEICPAI